MQISRWKKQQQKTSFLFHIFFSKIISFIRKRNIWWDLLCRGQQGINNILRKMQHYWCITILHLTSSISVQETTVCYIQMNWQVLAHEEHSYIMNASNFWHLVKFLSKPWLLLVAKFKVQYLHLFLAFGTLLKKPLAVTFSHVNQNHDWLKIFLVFHCQVCANAALIKHGTHNIQPLMFCSLIRLWSEDGDIKTILLGHWLSSLFT